MVFSVGDVKIIAAEREALRTIESRFIERAVGCARSPVPIVSTSVPSSLVITMRL